MQDSSGGACCVTAIIEGQDIVVANVGDCRAVLCRGGLVEALEALTTDHKPNNEEEQKRIEDEVLVDLFFLLANLVFGNC